MPKAQVALIPCENYDYELVYTSVSAGLALLGGISSFVSPSEKILLKPNLLSKALPQKAITTHPAIFAAVARILRESGFSHLSYGDSPGNPTTAPDRAAETAGISAEAEKYSVPMANFASGSIVRYPAGRVAGSFFLADGAREADAIINLPKMKTHALERITGAVKNMYGCVLGPNKAAGHVLHPDSCVFADMLADLNLCLKPRLHILDGIEAMEGNGPTSGTPIPMRVILISADPVALDSAFARLINLPPESVPTCASGSSAGLGVMEESEISVLTPFGALTLSEAARKYGNPAFDVFRGRMRKSALLKLAPLLPILQERPRVDLKKCVGCGVCMQACPAPEKAVVSGDGEKARYDYKKCIRCFCCQEMCPAKAITVYRSPLSRLL